MSSTPTGTAALQITNALNWTNQTIFSTNTATTAKQASTYDLSLLIPLLLCCIGVLIIGVPGNMMVIYVLGIRQRMNRNNDGNVFIVSLAVADLLASATVPLVIMHDLLFNHKWYLGRFFCRLLPVLNPVTLVTSSWALVVISVDRYRIISRPFSAPLPRKAKAILIASVWIFGIIVNIPLTMQIRYYRKIVCIIKLFPPIQQLIYASLFTTVGWLIPGIVLSILYFKTANQLRNNEALHSNSQVMQRQVRRENQQVVRMFVIIIFLFFLFTTPNTIYQIIYTYLYLFNKGVIAKNIYLSKLYLIFPGVSAMNSCVNPLVYAKMHREVNRYTKSIWRRFEHACLGRNRENRCSEVTQSLSRRDNTQIDTLVATNPREVCHETVKM